MKYFFFVKHPFVSDLFICYLKIKKQRTKNSKYFPLFLLNFIFILIWDEPKLKKKKKKI